MNRILSWLNPRVAGGLQLIHIHLAVIAAVVLGISIGISGVFVTQRFIEHGGLIPPRHLPPAQHVTLTGALPASASLDGFVTRIHNQGASNSCVAQTLSAITEIEAAERGVRQAFSAGYIYDQISGGVDRGSTYDAAFGVLTAQGDAPYNSFPHDAIDWWAQPDGNARAAAYPWHATSWRYIQPTDRGTIEYYITHGIPVAFAAGWLDSWVQHFGTSTWLPYPSGTLNFYHSTTLIGFSQSGVELLNSWGPGYGINGRVWLSWDVLAAAPGGFAAVSDTAYPYPVVKRRYTFPLSVWNHPRASRHMKLLSPFYRGHRGIPATEFFRHGTWKRSGGIWRQYYDKRNKVSVAEFMRRGHISKLYYWASAYSARHRAVKWVHLPNR